MTRREWEQWFYGLSFGFSLSSMTVIHLAVWYLLAGAAVVALLVGLFVVERIVPDRGRSER